MNNCLSNAIQNFNRLPPGALQEHPLEPARAQENP